MYLFLPWRRIWCKGNFTVKQERKTNWDMKRCEAHGPGILGGYEIHIGRWIWDARKWGVLLPCCPVVAQRPRRQCVPEASSIPYHPPSHYAGFITLHPIDRLTAENKWTDEFADDASVAVAFLTEADKCPPKSPSSFPNLWGNGSDLRSKILKFYVCLLVSLNLLPTSLEICSG